MVVGKIDLSQFGERSEKKEQNSANRSLKSLRRRPYPIEDDSEPCPEWLQEYYNEKERVKAIIAAHHRPESTIYYVVDMDVLYSFHDLVARSQGAHGKDKVFVVFNKDGFYDELGDCKNGLSEEQKSDIIHKINSPRISSTLKFYAPSPELLGNYGFSPAEKSNLTLSIAIRLHNEGKYVVFLSNNQVLRAKSFVAGIPALSSEQIETKLQRYFDYKREFSLSFDSEADLDWGKIIAVEDYVRLGKMTKDGYYEFGGGYDYVEGYEKDEFRPTLEEYLLLSHHSSFASNTHTEEVDTVVDAETIDDPGQCMRDGQIETTVETPVISPTDVPEPEATEESTVKSKPKSSGRKKEIWWEDERRTEDEVKEICSTVIEQMMPDLLTINYYDKNGVEKKGKEKETMARIWAVALVYTAAKNLDFTRGKSGNEFTSSMSRTFQVPRSTIGTYWESLMLIHKVQQAGRSSANPKQLEIKLGKGIYMTLTESMPNKYLKLVNNAKLFLAAKLGKKTNLSYMGMESEIEKGHAVTQRYDDGTLYED